jgi:hypothetical protein
MFSASSSMDAAGDDGDGDDELLLLEVGKSGPAEANVCRLRFLPPPLRFNFLLPPPIGLGVWLISLRGVELEEITFDPPISRFLYFLARNCFF